MPVLYFSSFSVPFEKDGLKSKINKMHKFAHKINIGNYWQFNEIMIFL